jgi:serine/threonine-protein kinase
MSHDPDATFIALQAALAGEYSLDRELGRGGMGVVYLARAVVTKQLAMPAPPIASVASAVPPRLGVRRRAISAPVGTGRRGRR